MLVGHSLHGGGAEFVSRAWSEELSRRGHSVTFVTLDADARASFLPSGVQHIAAGSGRAGGALSRVRAIRKSLRAESPDLVLAMQTYPALAMLIAALGRRRRPKLLLSERNIPSLLLRAEGVGQRIQLGLARRLYRYADAVIAISHPVAADLIGGLRVSPSRCFVVPNPAVRARPVDSRPLDARGDEVVLNLPFRLVKQKSPLLAIECGALLQSRGYQVKLVSYGRGPLDSVAKAYARKRGVLFEQRGWVEEWYRVAEQESISILPSYYEGFGNVLVESALAGIPSVVWSGALGVADAVVPGVTGEFAALLTPKAFADCVERIVRAQRDQRGKAYVAPSAWLRRFSLHESVDILESVFDQVLSA